jgi:hypothetical protein
MSDQQGTEVPGPGQNVDAEGSTDQPISAAGTEAPAVGGDAPAAENVDSATADGTDGTTPVDPNAQPQTDGTQTTPEPTTPPAS